MQKLSVALTERFRRVDGWRFRAILTPPPNAETNTHSNYRIMYVRNPSILHVGDVVKSHGGEFILLMEHPNENPNHDSFKAAYAKLGTWSRLVTVIDPVSKVPKKAIEVDQGPIYLNFDVPENLPAGVLNDVRYRFMTGQNVQLGDKINGKSIKVIYDVLGVKLGYAD